MKRSRTLLYFACFVALAATSVAVIDGVGEPTIAPQLLLAVLVAALAAAPGLVRPRLWPLALLLLPLGALLLLRVQLAPPPTAHGLGEQLAYIGAQLRTGAAVYARQRFPLDFSGDPGLTALVCLAFYAVTAAAAFVGLSLRAALPAIAIVLVVLGFGFTADQVTRVVWPSLAFLVLAGCMLVLSRSLRREHWRATDALAGAATATIAALLAFSLLGATSVAATRPLQDWRTWGVGGPGTTLLAFDWMANYATLLDPQSDDVVMRVESPVAAYWRANALTEFDGATWFSGGFSGESLPPSPVDGAFVYSVPLRTLEPPGKVVEERFQVVSTYTDYLFAGGSPRAVTVAESLPLRVTGAGGLAMDRPTGPSLEYAVTAVVPQVKASELVGRGRDYPPEVLMSGAALPFPTLAQIPGMDQEASWRAIMSVSPAAREWLGLYRLDRQMVGTDTDPYQIALDIEKYLRAHYDYSLELPRSDDQSPYAAFLFQTRTGYCQHFAGAMAILLRFNGIPARVAVGFSAGDRGKNGVFTVRRNDAHAWVEAYFPGLGWVTFDPTPGHTIPGAGASSANAGFDDPYSAAAVAGRTASPSPSAAATARAGARSPRLSRGLRESAGPTGAAPPERTSGWVYAGLMLAAALVVWPLGRALLRRRAVRRGDCERRLRASLALLQADLRDFGLPAPASQTLDETARRLRDELGLDAGPLVDRVQAVLYGGRAATPQDLADLAAFRRRLRRRLRERSGRLRALLALYGLPAPAPAGA